MNYEGKEGQSKRIFFGHFAVGQYFLGAKGIWKSPKYAYGAQKNVKNHKPKESVFTY